MLDSGLPIAQAIRYITDQTQNDLAKEMLEQISADLENGYRFSEAVKKHPKLFDEVFVSVVAAGESSGKLAEVLSLLASEEERQLGFKGRIIGALLYPAFIIIAMIVVAIIMVTRTVPVLETVFMEAQIDLPWQTRALVAITHSLIGYWWLYIIGLIVLVFIVRQYLATDEGRHNLNRLSLKIPAIGGLVDNLELARFTRIFSMLISSGVPIIQAILSVSKVLDNLIYREALDEVAHNVERGAPISQSLSKQPVFPVVVYQMVGVGEQTGKLEEVLKKLADYYEQELDQSIKNLTSLVEPVIFVIVGLGVAFLVFAIIMPIYGLSAAIK